MAADSEQVFAVYDVAAPPPHPGQGWTRFICISDTHSRKYPIPPGDVLLHAGDLSSWGGFKHLKSTVDWLAALPHPVKIITAGNHDLCLDLEWQEGGVQSRRGESVLPEKEVTTARAYVRSETAKGSGIHYLEHESSSVSAPSGKTWKIYASPAAQAYHTGAFQYTGGPEARAIYDRIPRDVEILLTHTPAHNILDQTRRGVHAGCPILAQTLTQLEHCRLHVFGHIHEAHGALTSPRASWYPLVSINAALQKEGQAVIVDLKE